MERNPDRRVPSALLEDFGFWSRVDSERALVWLATLAPGSQHDDFAKRLVEERTQMNERDLAELAGVAARIGDFRIRTEANRLLKTAWKPDDAAIIAEWEESLPEKERERLKRDVGDQ